LAAQTFPASLIQFYGLSEALAPIAALSAADHDRASETVDAVERSRLLSSTGPIVPGVRARVVDTELSVQADTVTPGYWNRADLNAAVLSPDRWFSTGDHVEIDGEGYLHVLGRGSDVIISGGFNVHAAEVERVLSQVPGITEVAVFGVPHPVWGMGVAAVVVAREPASEEFARPAPALDEAIRTACAANLAGYKKPTIVRLVNAIPRTSADKIDRNRLQQLFAAQQEGGHASS
jgi:acyl-CoA synthetase (AMP-forming)/AMP-acid ligase II